MAAVLGGAAVPWAVLVPRDRAVAPETALNPWSRSATSPCSCCSRPWRRRRYAAVRFAALFLVAAHAHFQGELRGARRGVLGVRRPRDPRRRSAATGRSSGGAARVLRDRLRARLPSPPALWSAGCARAESASRLRARGLSRRTIQAETEVRRRVAEAIHDGPVQELIGLDMILSAADAGGGRPASAEEAAGLIDEARELAARNVRVLRDEIVDLGPLRLRGAELRDRGRELHAGLEAPLRVRGAG